VNRLSIALAAYAVIAVLAWTTLDDTRIRLVTLAILAMFAVRTVIHRKDAVHPDDGDVEEHKPM
jgi:hypothetical protein